MALGFPFSYQKFSSSCGPPPLFIYRYLTRRTPSRTSTSLFALNVKPIAGKAPERMPFIPASAIVNKLNLGNAATKFRLSRAERLGDIINGISLLVNLIEKLALAFNKEVAIGE